MRRRNGVCRKPAYSIPPAPSKSSLACKSCKPAIPWMRMSRFCWADFTLRNWTMPKPNGIIKPHGFWRVEMPRRNRHGLARFGRLRRNFISQILAGGAGLWPACGRGTRRALGADGPLSALRQAANFRGRLSAMPPGPLVGRGGNAAAERSRFPPLAKWIVSLRSALGAVARIAWRQPAGFRQALRPALSRAVAPPCHSGAQETSAGGRRKPVLAPHLLRFLHGCVHADNRLCSAVFGIH